MFVVAYLYNSNGMATWCWEAAHALKEQGQDVLLIASAEVVLPACIGVEVLRMPPASKPKSVVHRELSRLSTTKLAVISQVHAHLTRQGITPEAYFLNQTNLFDSEINTPQFVVAWTYPSNLAAYWRKIFRITGGKLSIRVALEAIGWWRKDWKTYRSGATTLAVSKRLAHELQQEGVNSKVVHPGTNITPYPEDLRQNNASPDAPVKVVIASLKLAEPRKRVRWMLDAINDADLAGFELYLYGNASEDFQASLRDFRFPIHYMGYRQREDLQEVIPSHDIFLFGSRVDDWGYVLVEALASGLAVLAPDLSPFDEIIGSAGELYELDSKQDFVAKFDKLLKSDRGENRANATKRAGAKFSREVFGRQLMDAYEAPARLSAAGAGA